jgi:molecular chaperone HtpG
MREQFQVDLRGLVDVLSHHVYSSERVYLRELLQNGHDAIKARQRLGHDFAGRIEIVPARGYEQLVVRDHGIGLTGEDMRTLLSIIGNTSKRDDLSAARRDFLGQFGIGLLACSSSPTPSRSCLGRRGPSTRPPSAGWGRATEPSPSAMR